MDSEAFSEWLASLSVPERVRALARIYSSLTIVTRELFLPDTLRGKEQVGINMLHGLNEIHHTLANWLVAYTSAESKAFPVRTLSQQLLEIANQCRIGGFLTSAVEHARSRNPPANT
jgi:hypothetical protein